MSYSETEQKAIKNYMDKTGAKPMISLRPAVRFRLPNGEIIDRQLSNLMSEFNEARKEEAKERARQRKADKAKAGPTARRFV